MKKTLKSYLNTEDEPQISAAKKRINSKTARAPVKRPPASRKVPISQSKKKSEKKPMNELLEQIVDLLQVLQLKSDDEGTLQKILNQIIQTTSDNLKLSKDVKLLQIESKMLEKENEIVKKKNVGLIDEIRIIEGRMKNLEDDKSEI